MHVHICVGAQTGLGTMPPRPKSANLDTATTVSYRAEKQRKFESFIMENLLTATNSFHFEDDCAILSSDNSLRSRSTRTTAHHTLHTAHNAHHTRHTTPWFSASTLKSKVVSFEQAGLNGGSYSDSRKGPKHVVIQVLTGGLPRSCCPHPQLGETAATGVPAESTCLQFLKSDCAK